MIGLRINQARSSFFDSKKVMSKVPKAKRKALNEFGRQVRKKAQKSIVLSDEPSKPGHPPHGHRTLRKERTSKSTGRVRVQFVSPLREFIYYIYDANKDSVVIGPARLNAKYGDAPHALEHGGRSQIKAGGGQLRGVSIRPRPFMRPAFADELPNAAGYFRDSIR